MPRHLLPVLTLTFLASIAVMVAAAGNGSGLSFATAGAAFAFTVGIAALRILSELTSGPAIKPIGDQERHIISRSSALIALIYAWGGLAMFAVYPHAGLVWRHSWQYGLAMLLVAIGLGVYTRLLNKPGSVWATPRALDGAVALAVAHASAAAVALGYIVLADKLASPKDDWAAHWIFATGGLALVVVSALEVLNYRRLRQHSSR